MGGPVRAGLPYLVGERGPELVTFGGNGYVTPNHAMAGGGTTVNFNVSALDGPSVYRVLRDNESSLVRVIQNARGNRRGV